MQMIECGQRSVPSIISLYPVRGTHFVFILQFFVSMSHKQTFWCRMQCV
uniref:Uncharacterized protein n=1 Tax=Anguilla anguilla TaxID=7936 RepID=A0A0E9T884_ANGAN